MKVLRFTAVWTEPRRHKAVWDVACPQNPKLKIRRNTGMSTILFECIQLAKDNGHAGRVVVSFEIKP